jgi:hypothetical protein
MNTLIDKARAYKVWSNAFYLIPFFVATYFELWPTAFLCLAVGVFGTFYHLHRESQRYLWPDRISAWLLIATNVALCYLGAFKAPYFWIALLFLALALFYDFYLERRGQYSLNHGLWHLYGSLITLFSIFTFVL